MLSRREIVEAFVPLVSLGSWCGVKAACRGMGIGSRTLPLDWLRLSLEGALDALERGFEGFLEFDELCRHSFATPSGEVFHSRGRSFWHEDPRLPEVQEKYARRIARFQELLRKAAECGVPVVFVRSVATTFELLEAEAALRRLAAVAAPAAARLVLLLDAQPCHSVILVQELPQLLIASVSRHIDAAAEYSVKEAPYVSAYHAALRAALVWAARGEAPPDSIRLPGLASLLEAGNSTIRHVSLQEDLREPWSHDPHQPPAEVLRKLSEGPDCPERRIVAEMVQAHLEALLG